MCRLKTRQTSCCLTWISAVIDPLENNSNLELEEHNDLHHICAKLSANYRYIEEKNVGYRVVILFFLGSPKYNAHTLRFAIDEKLRGCLNLLCALPGGHWIRANIQCGHRKAVCLFKQETSEGARWQL